MRLASFVLPNVDNDGNDLSDVHAALQSAAVDNFGGFTALPSMGGWRDDKTGRLYVEPGRLYQFAMPDSWEADSNLESFARFYGHMAGQIAVMITYASGEIAFLECKAFVAA